MHHAAWGIALCMAALMGALLASPARPRAWRPWMAAALAAGAAINVGLSIQVLQSTRTVALVLACGFVLTWCFRLQGDPATRASGSPRSWVIAAMALSGAGLAAHGIYQVLFGFDRLAAAAGPGAPEAIRARIASGRAVATLGLPGALGGVLVITIPVTAGWMLAPSAGRGRRAAGAVLVAIQLAGLAATRSAAPVAALAAAAAITAWAVGWRDGSARGRRLRVAAIGAAAAGFAGAGALIAARLSAAGAAMEGTGPLALRLGNWKVALAILAEHPLFGTGAGCYGIAFPAYREWGMNESRYAHNSYLQALSEGGLALGVPVILAAVLMATALLRAARRPPEAGGTVAALGSVGCLAFLLHNLLDFTAYLPTVAVIFCCAAGSTLGSSPAEVATRPAARLRPGRAGAALVLALFALIVTRADLAKDRARSLALEGNHGAALDAAREAAAGNPYDPEARSLLSNVLLDASARSGDAAQLAAAEEEAQRAIDLDPSTPHHWHHLGRVRLAASDLQGAFVALRQAAALYPIRIEYREERDAVAEAIAATVGRP